MQQMQMQQMQMQQVGEQEEVAAVKEGTIAAPPHKQQAHAQQGTPAQQPAKTHVPRPSLPGQDMQVITQGMGVPIQRTTSGGLGPSQIGGNHMNGNGNGHQHVNGATLAYAPMAVNGLAHPPNGQVPQVVRMHTQVPSRPGTPATPVAPGTPQPPLQGAGTHVQQLQQEPQQPVQETKHMKQDSQQSATDAQKDVPIQAAGQQMQTPLPQQQATAVGPRVSMASGDGLMAVHAAGPNGGPLDAPNGSVHVQPGADPFLSVGQMSHMAMQAPQPMQQQVSQLHADQDQQHLNDFAAIAMRAP